MRVCVLYIHRIWWTIDTEIMMSHCNKKDKISLIFSFSSLFVEPFLGLSPVWRWGVLFDSVLLLSLRRACVFQER